MTMKSSNINLPTPAKWIKLGSSLVAASTFISGYGLSESNKIIGFIGLGVGVLGTFIMTFMS